MEKQTTNDKYTIQEYEMKSLKYYITESVKTYDYTIKIAGDVDKNFLDMLGIEAERYYDALEYVFKALDPTKATGTDLDKIGYH